MCSKGVRVCKFLLSRLVLVQKLRQAESMFDRLDSQPCPQCCTLCHFWWARRLLAAAKPCFGLSVISMHLTLLRAMYGTFLPSRVISVYVIFTAYSEIYIELCQMIHYLRKRIFPKSRVGNGQRATASALPAECRYAAQVQVPESSHDV